MVDQIRHNDPRVVFWDGHSANIYCLREALVESHWCGCFPAQGFKVAVPQIFEFFSLLESEQFVRVFLDWLVNCIDFSLEFLGNFGVIVHVHHKVRSGCLHCFASRCEHETAFICNESVVSIEFIAHKDRQNVRAFRIPTFNLACSTIFDHFDEYAIYTVAVSLKPSIQGCTVNSVELHAEKCFCLDDFLNVVFEQLSHVLSDVHFGYGAIFLLKVNQCFFSAFT